MRSVTDVVIEARQQGSSTWLPYSTFGQIRIFLLGGRGHKGPLRSTTCVVVGP